ncbi:MAG TPA: hypothetical protein HPP80_04030 [Rhodospirillaceae bacterium]|nr:hypothetical protein [Rhodospirillaceae bacterium]
MSHSRPLKEISCLFICSTREMRNLLARVIQQVGIGNVQEARDLDLAKQLVRTNNFDLIIWAGSDQDYLDLLRHIRYEARENIRKTPFLCVTSRSDMNFLIEGRDAGITGFLTMPLTLRDTLRKVNAALDDPREFVLTPSYVGPTRRRKTLQEYFGPRRRAEDGPTSQLQTTPTALPAASEPAIAIKAPQGPTDRPPGSQETLINILEDQLLSDWQDDEDEEAVEANGPIKHSANFRRRAQVVREAFRLVTHINEILLDPNGSPESSKSRISEPFNRLLNLMALVQAYGKNNDEDSDFFKEKYKEIMNSMSNISANLLAGGLERTLHQSQKMVNDETSSSLGGAYKTYSKMSEYEALIGLLGGYPSLTTAMLDQVKQIWENVLLLAERGDSLGVLDGTDEKKMRQVASERLVSAQTILRERPAADSQNAVLQKMRQP